LLLLLFFSVISMSNKCDHGIKILEWRKSLGFG